MLLPESRHVPALNALVCAEVSQRRHFNTKFERLIVLNYKVNKINFSWVKRQACPYLKKRGSCLMLFSSFHFLLALWASSIRCFSEAAISTFPSSRYLQQKNEGDKIPKEKVLHCKNISNPWFSFLLYFVQFEKFAVKTTNFSFFDNIYKTDETYQCLIVNWKERTVWVSSFNKKNSWIKKKQILPSPLSKNSLTTAYFRLVEM